MNTLKFGLIFLIAASLGLSLGSCKKKGCIDQSASNYNSKAKKDDGSCTYKPVITLVGQNPTTVTVGATYVDGGATANAKGVPVDVTTDLSQVNTASTGSFVVNYTATNQHGTASASRTVNVVLAQSSYLGDYSQTNDCSATEFPLAGNVTVAAGTNSTEVIIQSAFTLVGGEIRLIIDGSNITIPNQSVSISFGTIEISGSGTMNATGTEMTLNFNYDNTTPFIGGQGSCSATYSK
jgi:hypothetical protein